MNRRDQIIDAVINKFQQDGFSNDLTITEIAKSVDIGKSTVYEYFKSKDDLIKESLLKMFSCNTDRIINIAGIEEMNFEDAFKAQLSELLQSANESKVMFEVYSKDFQNQLPPAIQIELMENMHIVKDLIEQRFLMIMIKGVQEEKIKIDQDPMNANIISALVIGSIIRFTYAKTDFEMNGFLNKVFEAVLKLGN